MTLIELSQESACYFTWYPQSQMGTTEKIWTFFMVTVIGKTSRLKPGRNFKRNFYSFKAFAGCMCLIMSIKRGIEGRRQTAREAERDRNLEEGRDMFV